MTLAEGLLCLVAVCLSSASQLAMKGATRRHGTQGRVVLLGLAIFCQLCAVFVAVLVLRTLALSQLVAVAAVAYVLVPMGGALVFGERLQRTFWLGAGLIVSGLIIATR